MKKTPLFLIRVDRQAERHLKVPYTDRLAKRTDMLSCDEEGNVIKIIEDPGRVITSIDIEGESYQIPMAVAEYISSLEAGGSTKPDVAPDPKVVKKADRHERSGLVGECYNKTAKLFKPWVKENLKQIAKADDADMLFVHAKWRRFYGEEPFPGQEPEEKKEEKAA